jgi:hypothetical protein
LAHFAHLNWPTSTNPDARRCWTGSAIRPTSSRPGPSPSVSDARWKEAITVGQAARGEPFEGPGVGGSARRGQNGGPQGALCHLVDGSGNITRLAGWRAGDLTLRELPLEGKVQKRIVRPAARGNAGSGCCQRKHRHNRAKMAPFFAATDRSRRPFRLPTPPFGRNQQASLPPGPSNKHRCNEAKYRCPGGQFR